MHFEFRRYLNFRGFDIKKFENQLVEKKIIFLQLLKCSYRREN